MPIFVAVLTVTRSGRTEVRTLPYAGPPLWRMLAHEAADVLRRLRKSAPSTPTRRGPDHRGVRR